MLIQEQNLNKTLDIKVLNRKRLNDNTIVQMRVWAIILLKIHENSQAISVNFTPPKIKQTNSILSFYLPSPYKS